MSKIRTVFIVTQGDYSAFRILSVWDTLEEARKHAPAKTSYGVEPDIEEWVLNQGEGKTVIQWSACLDPTTGNIVVQDKPDEVQRVDRTAVRLGYGGEGPYWYGWGYGPTPEHARKSLADALAKAKVEQDDL